VSIRVPITKPFLLVRGRRERREEVLGPSTITNTHESHRIFKVAKFFAAIFFRDEMMIFFSQFLVNESREYFSRETCGGWLLIASFYQLSFNFFYVLW